MPREKLPNRRRGEVFDFIHETPDHHFFEYTVTTGYYNDGRLGELFIQNRRNASLLDVAVRDAAIGLSVGLQHGLDPADIVGSFLHDSNGKPEGVLGQLLLHLREHNLLNIGPMPSGALDRKAPPPAQ